jgi:hypothetical protein
MQKYGVPLDSRTHLTKTDWSSGVATLAEISPISKPSSLPSTITLTRPLHAIHLADSYETDKIQSGGMHARPVVGGVFIKMLASPELWKKVGSTRPHQIGNLGAAAGNTAT